MGECIFGTEAACKAPDNPFYRIEQRGPRNLSDAELIAIIAGIPTKRAISLLGKKGLQGLARRKATSLLALKSLDKSSTWKIQAWTELCGRLGAEEFLREKKVTGPDDLKELLRRHSFDDKEGFYIAMFDSRNQLMDIRQVCSGTTSACLVTMEDVFGSLLVEGAQSFVAIHNHPSGDPNPSMEDELLSKAIFDAAKLLRISMLDAAVVADDRLVTFRDGKFGPWNPNL